MGRGAITPSKNVLYGAGQRRSTRAAQEAPPVPTEEIKPALIEGQFLLFQKPREGDIVWRVDSVDQHYVKFIPLADPKLPAKVLSQRTVSESSYQVIQTHECLKIAFPNSTRIRHSRYRGTWRVLSAGSKWVTLKPEMPQLRKMRIASDDFLKDIWKRA